MDVNYGKAVKKYLLDKVTLLRIHRFDPNEIQFEDALVSSAIVWFRNDPPPADHQTEFTFGGSLLSPKLSRLVSTSSLRKEAKWTRFPILDVREKETLCCLSDLFTIKRGIATGHNNFFILKFFSCTANHSLRGFNIHNQLPHTFLILPSASPLFWNQVFSCSHCGFYKNKQTPLTNQHKF